MWEQAMENKALILAASGDFEKAFKSIDEAERIRRKTWSNDKVGLAQNHLNCAFMRGLQGDYASAIRAYE